MRKLIVANIISLDGFYEGPNRNVMALPMDHSFDAYNAERLQAADTLLLGARTYTLFQGFWPSVKENPGASEAQRQISLRNDAIEKLVVSDTVGPEQTGPWRSTTHIVRRAEAHRQLAELKHGPGRDILIFGSRTLWHDLLATGLVDELHLMLGPIVLGAGTPAFPSTQAAPLRLLATRRWEGSSNLLLQYAVEPPR
jgi:dihydrofolate reductase